MQNSPLAIVLVGGGGCGRWQAGALDAIERSGFIHDVSIIVGTSVGGLNGCALAIGLSKKSGSKDLIDAWSRIKSNADIYTPDLLADVAHPWAHPIDEAVESHSFIFGNGALNTDKLVALVKDVMADWDTDKVLSASGITLRTRAMHYERQRAESLAGDLGPMALATSAIEGLFPARYGFGDGGAVDNEPIGEALRLGAKRILVVFCGPEDPADNQDIGPTVIRWDDKAPSRTGLQNALSTLTGITQRGEALADEAAGRAEKDGVQLVYCYPPTDTGSALDFSPRGLLKRGQAEATKAIEEMRSLGW